MRVFHHPDQSLHDTKQYMRFGKVVDPKDLPERIRQLLLGVAQAGLEVEQPAGEDAQILTAIAAIHPQYYLDFLHTAWQEWQKLPAERGPEVWPNTFPYWSGRPDQPARGPCRADSFLGRLGWYLGDLSVPIVAHTWQSILASARTALAGADAVMAGSNAYALCRPSGHHARADRASGFCYLNNTAIAAERLRQKFKRVAVLDIDAHHGDGTQQIFYHRADVQTISLHADPSGYYPFFTGYADETGFGEGLGFNLNLPLAHGSRLPETLAALQTACAAIQAANADALVIALGFDAHKNDPIGVLGLQESDYCEIARLCAGLGLPTLIVQEGGYAIDILAGSLQQFLRGFHSR